MSTTAKIKLISASLINSLQNSKRQTPRNSPKNGELNSPEIRPDFINLRAGDPML